MPSSDPPSYASNESSSQEKTREKSKRSPKTIEDTTVDNAGNRPRTTHHRQHREITPETLKLLAGDRARRSRCDPEFLEEFAKAISDHNKETDGNYKIITGSEARAVYKKYLK